MKENLLKLFELADKFNEKQGKLYAEIKYYANDSKKLEISIRSKIDYEYIESLKVQLKEGSIVNWGNILNLFKLYVEGGSSNE